jgi:predicted nucleotidyltransferase
LIEKIAQSLKHNLNKLDSGKRTVVAVYLFGSRIKGDAKKNSDLDIAFLLDERAYRNDPLATVAPAYLSATNLGMHLAMETDVNILNAASLEIAYEVITTGKCLLEYDADKRMEYEIALRGMYFDFKPFLDELRANCINDL